MCCNFALNTTCFSDWLEKRLCSYALSFFKFNAELLRFQLAAMTANAGSRKAGEECCWGFRVWGLGLKVEGLGFGDHGS